MERLLYRIQGVRPIFRQIPGEISQKRLLREPALVTVEYDSCRCRRCWKLPGQRRIILSCLTDRYCFGGGIRPLVGGEICAEFLIELLGGLTDFVRQVLLEAALTTDSGLDLRTTPTWLSPGRVRMQAVCRETFSLTFGKVPIAMVSGQIRQESPSIYSSDRCAWCLGRI